VQKNKTIYHHQILPFVKTGVKFFVVVYIFTFPIYQTSQT